MYIEKNLKQNRRLAFGYSRIFGHELPEFQVLFAEVVEEEKKMFTLKIIIRFENVEMPDKL